MTRSDTFLKAGRISCSSFAMAFDIEIVTLLITMTLSFDELHFDSFISRLDNHVIFRKAAKVHLQ